MKPRLARFEHTYTIEGKTYQTTTPGVSAAHCWRNWDRPGAKLVRVEEVNENNMPCYP
jgi:hypothetical protein